MGNTRAQGEKGDIKVQLKRKFSATTLNQTASQGDTHITVFFLFCPWCRVVHGHDPVFSGAGRMGIFLFLFLLSLFSSFLMYEITPFFTVDTYLWG